MYRARSPECLRFSPCNVSRPGFNPASNVARSVTLSVCSLGLAS